MELMEVMPSSRVCTDPVIDVIHKLRAAEYFTYGQCYDKIGNLNITYEIAKMRSWGPILKSSYDFLKFFLSLA